MTRLTSFVLFYYLLELLNNFMVMVNTSKVELKNLNNDRQNYLPKIFSVNSFRSATELYPVHLALGQD